MDRAVIHQSTIRRFANYIYQTYCFQFRKLVNTKTHGRIWKCDRRHHISTGAGVDMIFLDIKMPQLSGTEFVRSLRNVPKIIFTTAYKEFAHEGFELDVIDYLLKPIRFDRFLRAVNKAFPQKLQAVEVVNSIPAEDNKPATSFIYLRVDRKMIKVLLNDIVYIESAKDYVKVFTEKGFVITRQTIASVEAMLSESQFIRVHRSYIVSLNKLKSFTAETVEIGDKELPIGKLYRNNFLKLQGS